MRRCPDGQADLVRSAAVAVGQDRERLPVVMSLDRRREGPKKVSRSTTFDRDKLAILSHWPESIFRCR
jgi:hypothetical protein